jgi:integrase
MPRDLPPRVFEKSGSYYHVRAEGSRRVWTRLCRVREGLPAMYRALAEMEAVKGLDDTMPKLIADWTEQVSAQRSKKTQDNDAYRTRTIAESFAKFRAGDVQPPDVSEFLRYYRDRPRTHNAYRTTLRDLMRFAEEKGFRPPGTNPVDAIKPMQTRARTRYLTDSEVRRIKVGAMYGGKGERENTKNRSGPVLCALIDMAYLTGQRIGDLLALQWASIDQHGITFEPSKVKDRTHVRIVIEWTPKLRALVDRIKALKKRNIRFVFTTQDGQPYTYSGASSAWKRAVQRAKVKDVHFHDLRAKALTDKDRAEGMDAARTMGGHSTQDQTADYVRHRTAKKTAATR